MLGDTAELLEMDFDEQVSSLLRAPTVIPPWRDGVAPSIVHEQSGVLAKRCGGIDAVEPRGVFHR